MLHRLGRECTASGVGEEIVGASVLGWLFLESVIASGIASYAYSERSCFLFRFNLALRIRVTVLRAKKIDSCDLIKSPQQISGKMFILGF